MENLPNLHPAVIHFPIALFSIVFFLEGLRIFFNKNWINVSALFLSGLAAAGTIASYLTGKSAADSMELNADQIPFVSRHSDLAFEVMIMILSYFLIRVSFFVLKRKNGTIIRVLIFVLTLIPMFWIVKTADAGGALVYKYNLGRVTSEKNNGIKDESIEMPKKHTTSKRFIGFNVDGQWSWQSSEENSSEFLSAFGLPDSIKSDSYGGDSPELSFIKLSVNSGSKLRTFFSEPGQNIVIEVIVDLSGLSGEFSLFRNFSGSDYSEDILRIKEGWISFVRSSGGEEKIFGSKKIDTERKFRLKLSAYEKHFQAYIDGKLILHGHGKPLKGRRMGFILNGKGELKIYSFKIQKLNKN